MVYDFPDIVRSMICHGSCQQPRLRPPPNRYNSLDRSQKLVTDLLSSMSDMVVKFLSLNTLSVLIVLGQEDSEAKACGRPLSWFLSLSRPFRSVPAR